MIFGFAAFVVLLILWGFAWRYQTKMAFGILIGLGLGGLLAQFIGPFETIQEIPVWLPATPLISVVIILFVLSFLAWGVQDTSSEDSDNSH
jgi:hypothetical protein